MRYFEDFRVGDVQRYGRYEVTREESIAFASRYDPQSFHLDDDAAEANPLFGRLSASGWHTVAMAMAMRIAAFAAEGGSSGLGGIGVDELRWLKPVYPGDVLRCEDEVIETIPSRSKPDRGVIKFRTTVFNQHDEVVATFVPIVLHRRRPG